MRWTGHAAAGLIILAASSPASPAQQEAPSDLTVIGKFYKSDGKAVLYVATTKPVEGKTPKGALVGVEFENSDENYRFNGTYTHLDAAFLTADDWRKFVVIWKRARSGQDSKADDYFDGQTELLVDPNHDGSVGFTLGGNGHDERNVPKDLTIFDLPAKDISEFDRDVKQVSAYFAK